MQSQLLGRCANSMKVRKSPKARLIRKSSVLVISIPGARKMSMTETNKLIRKSRDRKI